MEYSNPEFVSLLRKIQRSDIKTFIAKNADYGDSFRDLGLIGIFTRSLDKLKRAIQVLTTNELKIESETVRDTMNDLRIYTLMQEGLWREIEDEKNVKRKVEQQDVKSYFYTTLLDDKDKIRFLSEKLIGVRWSDVKLQQLEYICKMVNIL